MPTAGSSDSRNLQAYAGMYCDIPALFLENEFIQLTVLPEIGGKIASIYHKPQAFELLYQPKNGEYKRPYYGASFGSCGLSGIDDCLPNIDTGIYPEHSFSGIQLPDHGEVWSQPWTFRLEDHSLAGSVLGCRLPYTFGRSITLQQNEVHIHYFLRNTGSVPLRCLWTFHGLLACDEYSEIHLAGVQKIINVKESRYLGPSGTVHSFPVSRVGNCDVALNRVRPKTSRNKEKYFVHPDERTGDVSITLNRNRLRFQMLFSPEELPYCGIWINEGAFDQAYIAALEPSNGYYDSMETACRNNTLAPLDSGAQIDWILCIRMEELS